MDLARLLQQIDDAFDTEDLRVLCFELKVDFGNLVGEKKRSKAAGLIQEMQRQGRLPDLVARLAARRPNIDWERPAEPDPATLDEAAAPAGTFTERVRPARGGHSVGHYRAGAATLGCLVVDRSDPTQLFLLSDLSGLCPAGVSRRVGDPILQPGRADGGDLSRDVIATLARWGELREDPLAATENVSAALAQVRRWEDVSPEIEGVGMLPGVAAAAVGQPVMGVGRTGGLVRGEVTQVDAIVELPWPRDQVTNPSGTGDGTGVDTVPVLFGGLIACTFMLGPGDSGMVLLDGDGRALGLGFAGSDSVSYFLPIARVLQALRVELVTAEVWQALTAAPATEEAVAPPAEGSAVRGAGDPAAVADMADYGGQVQELRRQLQRGRLALFFGADFPLQVTGLPGRAEMAAQLARRAGLPVGLGLPATAQAVMAGGNRWEFTSFLREVTDTVGRAPAAIHDAVVRLVTKGEIATVITTTYDDLLEVAFRQAGVGLNVVVRPADLGFTSPDRPTLIRLFGQSQQADTLVVTEQDIGALVRGRLKAELVDEVQHVLRRYSVLYLGHDVTDTAVATLLDDVAGGNTPRSYAVWPGLTDQERAFLLTQRQIEVLPVDPGQLLQKLLQP